MSYTIASADLAQRLKDKNGEILLREYLTAYGNYCTASSSIRKILAYLHRFWIPSHRNETIQGIQVRETVPVRFLIVHLVRRTPLIPRSCRSSSGVKSAGRL